MHFDFEIPRNDCNAGSEVLDKIVLPIIGRPVPQSVSLSPGSKLINHLTRLGVCWRERTSLQQHCLPFLLERIKLLKYICK